MYIFRALKLSFLKEGTSAFQYSLQKALGRHTASTDYLEKWVHGNFISQNHRLSLKHYQGHVQTFSGYILMKFLWTYEVVAHQIQQMPTAQLTKMKSFVSRLLSAFLFCILSTERYRTETPLYMKQYISLDKSNSRCTCLCQPTTPSFGLQPLCHNNLHVFTYIYTHTYLHVIYIYTHTHLPKHKHLGTCFPCSNIPDLPGKPNTKSLF